MRHEHAMIDIETWGNSPGSAFSQIGAVAFNIADGSVHENSFFRNVSLSSCQAYGMHVEAHNVEWWMGQSDEARRGLFDPPAVRVDIVLHDFSKWLEYHRIVFPWSHGSNYDLTILEAAWVQVFDEKPPWTYKNVRDTRTISWLARHGGWEYTVAREGIKHNALNDATFQAKWVSSAFTYLNTRGHRP